MLQHVWERARQSCRLSRLVIATDDARIEQAARSFGAQVVMTQPGHPSGSDRAAEVASRDPAAIVVNIQGDEPLIDPRAIDAVVETLLGAGDAAMATLMNRIADQAELGDPNVVKVICDRAGYAIYFSRLPVPYVRSGTAVHFRHIGLYAYRREFLLAFPSLPVGPLESAEKLEQLRALENGFRIKVAETAYQSLGVDTAQDLERVRAIVEKSPGNLQI